jgi:exonuclease SbcD
VTTTKLAVPVPRQLRQVRGTLDELLANQDADLAKAWVKVILTDTVRPPSPMERLRERWPHTLVLDFAPEGELPGPAADLRRLARAADPAEICGMFVEFTSGGWPDGEQRAVLADVIESVQHADTQDAGSVTTLTEAA